MNFGIRLPGPFRVGVSSSGRITGGMNLGPFSVSGNLSGARPEHNPRWPMTLDQAAGQAAAEGFKVRRVSKTSVMIRQGWKKGMLVVVPGGVELRRMTSNWKIVTWIGAVVAVILFCDNVLT